ncbi:carbonic anhydrase 14-like [Photinus pyralis]|nr:carbonic anhydrase 14-like [Photinus pyralis]
MYLLYAVLLLAFVSASFSETCEPGEGLRQSPINIITKNALRYLGEPLSWSEGYKKVPSSMTLENDGSTLKLTVKSTLPLILNTHLWPPYRFAKIHFHWGTGPSNTIGTEHKIDGQSYALEMHAVHEAIDEDVPDKYLVVAYLFKVSEFRFSALDPIADAAITAAISSDQVAPFELKKLLFEEPFSYYTYRGSLTTPPYSPNVRFIVSQTILPISIDQLALFRIAAEENSLLSGNYRCLQPLNNRTVLYVSRW